MSNRPSMPTSLRAAATGRTREEAPADGSIRLPAPSQQALPFGEQQRVSDDTTDLYSVVRAAIERAGGIEWLTAALDREPSYVSKISEGLNRREGRHAQLDWLAPLLRDPRAARELLTGLCALCGFEPPQPRRVVTREEVATAILDVLADAGDVGEALRERVARRLGTDVGAVRL